MEDDQFIYKIALSLLPKIGNVMGRSLLAYAGSAAKVFDMSKAQLLKVPRIGELLANTVLANKENAMIRAEKEMQFLDKYNIKAYFYLDTNYPSRLKFCDDAPVVLYTKGLDCLQTEKALGIVGTRNASELGTENTETLVTQLAQSEHRPTIVSGLAYGIDIHAHKSALKNQLPTIAVLATGLDTIYPSVHTATAREIAEAGALVTEFISGTPPNRNNFLQRNRIIAALSDATIVVESGEKGGALSTAAYANQYGRDVFAFPGRFSDKFSIGCNRLIKNGKANVYESISDLFLTLKWDTNSKNTVFSNPNLSPSLFENLTETETQILELLKIEGGLQIDLILQKTSLPMCQISSSLLNLEFAGVVKAKPGKVYSCR